MIEIKLPYPPSVNRLYKTGKGRFYKSKLGHDYSTVIDMLFRPLRLPVIPKSSALRLHVFLYPNDKRLRDIDGGLKALLDALQYARVFENDAQIKDLHVIMAQPISRDCEPYCRIKLEIIE